uniref:Uncharacterized protein n=1 Tax=Oryzias melastigma TaxID=30732 RepID=A0A3B3D1H3_ORYME
VSITFTLICNVPDLIGFPPSTAVRISFKTGCVSRSKALLSTNSADTPCSPPLCTSSTKYSLGFSL